MEESLHIQRFEHPLSASDFESLIEPRNVPVVIAGCVQDWKAVEKWNPCNGGLEYLQERVGSCVVEAMLSRMAPVFYGDLRSHERVPLPFSSFIGFCKERMQEKNEANCVSIKSGTNGLAGLESDSDCLHSKDALQKFYLAQVPIFNTKNEERVQLESLRVDIQTPAFLAGKKIASINLWMNTSVSRSSTHYDPHHNLLCIVAGSKKVRLWPPSASPMLYLMPIYGEASNHSSVALENPDYSIYPRAKCSTEYSQTVVLHAGDALFIPEGWFHQVDSDDMTIAVNFWWQSLIMSSVMEHMDAYYLRIILRRLVDREMNHVLLKDSSTAFADGYTYDKPNYRGKGVKDLDHKNKMKILKGKELQQRVGRQELEPVALQALHELVAIIHEHVSVGDQSQTSQSTPTNDPATIVKDEGMTGKKNKLVCLDDDIVASTIWNLEPCVLQSVLLAMAHNFPRTLEALILHLLSPVGAEVLTRKFDEMDQSMDDKDQTSFYEIFYGAFDDQFAAMDAILNGKESFARQAFRNVLDKYLGTNLDEVKPCLDSSRKLVPSESCE